MKPRDVMGILLGIPMSLIVLGTLHSVVWPPDNVPYARLDILVLGIPCLLISIGLFLPDRSYEQKGTRRFGFVSLGLATALTVLCAVGSCYITLRFPSYPHDEWSLMGPFLAGGCLAACMVALSCACVLLFKLRPRPAHTRIWIAAGSVFGLVAGGMSCGVLGWAFALLRPHPLYYGEHAHKVVSCSAPFLSPGLLIGAIFGSALGAWIVRRALGQRGSFRKALLGALAGSVIPFVGTAIGAVIGSGWKAKTESQP